LLYDNVYFADEHAITLNRMSLMHSKSATYLTFKAKGEAAVSLKILYGFEAPSIGLLLNDW